MSRPLKRMTTARQHYIKSAVVKKRASPLKKIARKVNRLTKIVNTERRWQHSYYGRGNVDSAGVSGALSLVGVGDSDFQRTGNVIRAKHLKLRIILNNNNATNAMEWRVCIVQDTQNIGVAPGPNLIWDGTVFATNIATTAYRVPTSLKRFKVLADKIYHTNNDNPNKHIVMNIPLNFDIQYDGNATTDFRKNALFFFIWNNNNAGMTPDQYALASTFTFYP